MDSIVLIIHCIIFYLINYFQFSHFYLQNDYPCGIILFSLRILLYDCNLSQIFYLINLNPLIFIYH